jgi:cardiolipin synthase
MGQPAMAKQRVLALCLGFVLTGCATPFPTVRVDLPGVRATLGPPAVSTVAAPQSDRSDEPPPSEADLRRLESSSPDGLVAEAPPEPGYQAEQLGFNPPPEDLGNFGKVDDTLWRGARPTDKGLQKLVAMGVKTIVNLENDKASVEHEQAWARAHGVNFVSIPLSVITPPKLEKIKTFVSLAEDPKNRPLYFHCMQGRDRTGTGAFCYRIGHDGWTYDRAYREMVTYHFHTYLLGLRGFLAWYARTQAPAVVSGADGMTTGNSATLYVSPVETLPAVKALISNASRSVYLETFNFGNDSYGKQLLPLLVAKAQAGAEVNVLMDYLGSRYLPGHADLVKQLRAGGVHVQMYDMRTLKDGTGTRTFNITHRKVYLADGLHGLVGGVNLHSPFDTTTQDLLIDWRGPIVSSLYKEFAHDWELTNGPALGQRPVSVGTVGSVSARIAVTSPGEDRYEAREAIFKAVDGAKQEILIEQQYLWDDTLVKKLREALGRGVKERIIIPNPEQKVIQRDLNGEAVESLVEAGAQARCYLGITPTAHLHTKYFAVDDAWATTGSVNGDPRALNTNQELDVVTTDLPLVAQLRQRLFETDWGHHSEPFVHQPPSSWFGHKFESVLELLDYYL